MDAANVTPKGEQPPMRTSRTSPREMDDSARRAEPDDIPKLPVLRVNSGGTDDTTPLRLIPGAKQTFEVVLMPSRGDMKKPPPPKQGRT